MTALADKLAALADLLSVKARLARGSYARDAKGRDVDPCGRDAVAWDLIGGAEKVCGDDLETYHDVLRELFKALPDDATMMPSTDGGIDLKATLFEYADQISHGEIAGLIEKAHERVTHGASTTTPD